MAFLLLVCSCVCLSPGFLPPSLGTGLGWQQLGCETHSALTLAHPDIPVEARDIDGAESRGVGESGSYRCEGLREPRMGALKQGWRGLAESRRGQGDMLYRPLPMKAAQSPNKPE